MSERTYVYVYRRLQMNAMDGWMDGWMAGWWLAGWMDGWPPTPIPHPQHFGSPAVLGKYLSGHSGPAS